MPNKITVYPHKNSVQFHELEVGMLFRSMYPFHESNIYMKVHDQMNRSAAVLLTSGIIYAFPVDKEVEKIRTKIEIEP